MGAKMCRVECDAFNCYNVNCRSRFNWRRDRNTVWEPIAYIVSVTRLLDCIIVVQGTITIAVIQTADLMRVVYIIRQISDSFRVR